MTPSQPDRVPRTGSTTPPPGNFFGMELARNLRVDSISRLQPAPPHAIEVHEPVQKAIEIMRRVRSGCLLVTRGGALVGIFTDRDLLTRILAPARPLSTPMEECMTANPVAVQPKDSVQTAIGRMESGGYRHLPVVEDDHRPVGILSARRVVHYLVEHFPALVYNHPPDPKQVPDVPEGA